MKKMLIIAMVLIATINTKAQNKIENEISQLEKDAIMLADFMCEAKEMNNKLTNATSEEEYENLIKDNSDFQERAQNIESYMDAIYPDEYSKESLEIKDKSKILMLKCYSQQEIDTMFPSE